MGRRENLRTSAGKGLPRHPGGAQVPPRLGCEAGWVTTAEVDERRVLVVDDEETIAELVAAALRYEGFVVRQSHDGRSALGEVEKFRPHLVVLDIQLPDLD